MSFPPSLSRRDFLVMTGVGSAGLLLGACGRSATTIGPSDPAVDDAEARRRAGDATVQEIALAAAPLSLDLGGLPAATWAYNGSLPGPEVRVRAGDVLRVRFTNGLPEPTTIHWHGIALRNDMDGVPGLTQDPVGPGETFTYDFAVPDPGTFWFHPHAGLQLDRGLYAALVVEDPSEPGAYDREIVVVLDDWLDGIGKSPEETFADLRAGKGAHAAHTAAAGQGGPQPSGGEFLGGQGSGDVAYPIYLLNGRRAVDPAVFDVKPGERLRLRLVNAGSDTPFRVALGGHEMTVTHTDGFPVEPVTVDALVIGMGERYDVVVTVDGAGGTFPLVALAEAKGAQAMAVLRTGGGDLPAPNVRPSELSGRLLAPLELRASPRVALPVGRVDRAHQVVLAGGEQGYVWTINGKAHPGDHAEGHRARDGALEVQVGQRVRLSFENRTTMFHPMHLHGHTFQVVTAGGPGARKDTAIVRPNERVEVDFLADNPGQWMLHCHNLYHMQGGMTTTVSYVR